MSEEKKEQVKEEEIIAEEYKPKYTLSVVLDKDGYIDRVAVGCLYADETCHFEVDEVPEDLRENRHAYKVESLRKSGYTLTKDESKIKAVEEEHELEELRSRRETECFAVINRGGLWYELLTKEQKDEVMAWYKAWLNVTETKVVPEKPSWLS